MCDRLSEVLPLATRPIRYTGGEYNSLLREPGPGVVSWVLAMPEVYELGMSNYGLRILYSILNRQPDALCERCFVPWPDFGDLLQARGIPLYALESRRPVRGFDVLGVSLQSELACTNVLYLLDLAGIPLRREERDGSHPLVVAGGPCTANPLPMADFVDAFVVGDGEEAVLDINRVVKGCADQGRDVLLAELAKLAGIYVPGRSDIASATVRRRAVSELREQDFPFPPLLPICETTHDRLTVEINRGCTRGCRFCQAGMANRPVRFRHPDEIVRIAERGIRATGWEEVSLLSLSALDYPDLAGLVQRLNARLSERRVSLSLPSTRGEDFSPELAFDLQAVRKAGLTFAPETVSPRLKAFINKNIAEVRTLEATRTALDAGWGGVKLYFMVGLPTETSEDVEEIARFVDEVARLCRGRAVRYSMSPFVPKPHTPLQWAGFEGIEPARQKIETLRHRLTRRNIKAKWENPESSYAQALVARGDERLGPVIERVYRAGGVFQEWSERFDLGRWLEACAACGVDPDAVTGPRAPGERLSWDFVDLGVNKDFLRDEWERARRGETTPDCARAECSGCGVCPDNRPPERPAVSSPEERAYRRRSRAAAPLEQRVRLRLKYAVEEPYRFAGHLDRVRAWYRAVRRSELPVLYTRGYAPKPMLSFGPPLPVGVTSDGEYLDFFATSGYSGNIIRDLGPFMPRGLRLAGARGVPRDRPTLGKTINLGRYRVWPPREAGGAAAGPEGRPTINGVVALTRDAEDSFVLDLAIVPGVRLFETLAALLEIERDRARAVQVKRLDCLVSDGGRVSSPLED
jgi:radical SAM family uncharacterized protein